MVHVEEESRFICGKEQPCLIIPTETNQIKRGKQGNWLMILRLSECRPNARNMTHEVQQMYLTPEAIEEGKRLGYHDRTMHMGRVYQHDRTPSKKIDRTNVTRAIDCKGTVCLSDIPKDLIKRNAENNKRYLSKLTFKSMEDDRYVYTGYICLDDIPAHHIYSNLTNGKRYINVRFKKLVRLDTYMNTHLLVVVAGDGQEIEIGRFKEWEKSDNPAPQSEKKEEKHTTTVNPRPMPTDIDGIKF